MKYPQPQQWTARELMEGADDHGVVIPTQRTLDKYGLNELEWLAYLADAGWRCPVCLNASGTGKYVTDHQHIRGWSSMPPEERKLYVRGVVCWHCNRYLLAGKIDSLRAERVAKYLHAYEARRPA